VGGLRTPLGLRELLAGARPRWPVLGQTRRVFCGVMSGRRTRELASRQAGRKHVVLKGSAPVAGWDWDVSALRVGQGKEAWGGQRTTADGRP
jgi:hypothetical protein